MRRYNSKQKEQKVTPNKQEKISQTQYRLTCFRRCSTGILPPGYSNSTCLTQQNLRNYWNCHSTQLYRTRSCARTRTTSTQRTASNHETWLVLCYYCVCKEFALLWNASCCLFNTESQQRIGLLECWRSGSVQGCVKDKNKNGRRVFGGGWCEMKCYTVFYMSSLRFF